MNTYYEVSHVLYYDDSKMNYAAITGAVEIDVKPKSIRNVLGDRIVYKDYYKSIRYAEKVVKEVNLL